MEEYDYEDINETYEYGEKILTTNVRFFPEKSIATVTTVTEGEDDPDDLEASVLWYGMDSDELRHYFPAPPAQRKQGHEFNLSQIFRSIIYEAYRKEGLDLENGNVRNFWYTHIKYVVTNTLGLDTDDSVNSALNRAWGEMINSCFVNYEGMNITGGKEKQMESVVKDSPFSNLIIAVEKIDYYYEFEWIPRLFNSTLITAGGQPSRSVARAFIRKLQKLGVDLDQQFYMCVASDLDPAGYYIQDAFRKQFESAIKAYGGTGRVEIRRLFVRRDQVSQQLLESEAMPCDDSNAKTESAKKAEATKWAHFVRETNGGLYIPDQWNGKYPTDEVNGVPMVRALLEMNAFPKHIIERSILNELLKIILETNDESKIMIPEIMRIFEIMRDEAVSEVFEEWREKLVKPLIEKFLEQTKSWENDIQEQFDDDETDAEMKRNDETDPIDDECEELIEEQREEAKDRVPDLYEKKAELETKISELEVELEETTDDINDQCSDIFEKIEELEQECEDDKREFEELCEEEIEEAREKQEFRLEQLRKFRDEHATVFNPIDQNLFNDIKFSLSQDSLPYFFRDIEQLPQFVPHISRLLTEPSELEDNEVSCFEQDVPTFVETDLLHQASANKDENIGNVRNAFTPDFRNEMKVLVIDNAQDTYTVRGEVEDQDLTDDIDAAKESTEEQIDSGEYEE